MRHGVVEGEPGIFPYPAARFWRGIGRLARGRGKGSDPPPEQEVLVDPNDQPAYLSGCAVCELAARRDRGEAPAWDQIHRTPLWDVVHAYDTAIEGWLVLALRRHVESIAELTDPEAAELGLLLGAVSRALHEVVGCQKTYVAQFAERPLHRHVHVHVVPRSPAMPDDQIGPAVFSQLGVAEEQRVSEARMSEIAAGLAERLRTF